MKIEAQKPQITVVSYSSYSLGTMRSPCGFKSQANTYQLPEEGFSRLPAILIIFYYMHINTVRLNLGGISWVGHQNLGGVLELYQYYKTASIVLNPVHT